MTEPIEPSELSEPNGGMTPTDDQPAQPPVVTTDDFLSDDEDQPAQEVTPEELAAEKASAPTVASKESAPKPEINRAPGYRIRVRRGMKWGLVKKANKVRYFKKDEIRPFVEHRRMDQDHYKILCPDGRVIDVRSTDRFPRDL